MDLSKYLVPTEPIQEGTTPEDEAAYKEKHDEYNNMSPITGIFKSFGDSPNGFKGELEEIMASIGLEYNYNQQFFVRAVITMRINIRETVSTSQSVLVSA